MAYVLLKLIDTYKKGGKIDYSKLGVRKSDVESGYKYLAEVGYISAPSCTPEITEMGLDMMEQLKKRIKESELVVVQVKDCM